MHLFFTYVRKWFLLGFLILIFILFHFFHLYKYISFDAIKASQAVIKTWTSAHYILAVTLYLLIFIVMIAATIPGATILSLLAGFLFGSVGILYAILGTTLGGLLLFYAVRLALGKSLQKKPPKWLKKLGSGFRENAFIYLLIFRLIPIFPCWISNIAAGALEVPVGTFVLATVIGVAPASIIYVMAGRGLEKFFATNQSPSLSALLTPSLFFPLLGLAILSVIPVFYKGIKKYRSLG